ncbi:MAG TPA: amidohydrolase family protein [Vicinamibacterales bacterium]|nr:amidohydrolase family protein [Vicinamibacterales bacterium]
MRWPARCWPTAACSSRCRRISSAGALLDSATRQGARALGFDQDFGTIEPGKSARLLAVSIPPKTDDVEEWLVSGVEPNQIRWIGEA